MDERSREGRAFSSDTFYEPIRALAGRSVKTLDVSATMGECVDLMREENFGAAVITRNDRLAGIVTERDFLRKALDDVDWRERPVTFYMTPDPDSLQLDDPMIFVMNRMYVGGYRHVPIVDEDDFPVGIVSIRDVLTFILDHFQGEVSNLPPEPSRGPAPRWGG